MSYTLYNRSGSGGFVIEAVLELAGAPYRLENIASLPNEPLSDKIGHLNPWGQVPVLVLDDGTVMTELAAILAYLAQVEPGLRDGPHLWIDSDPLFLRWSVFLCVNAYEGILRRTYPKRFCVTQGNAVADQAMIASVTEAAEARTHEAFQCLEHGLGKGGFILGARMSACDVLLAMLYAWHKKRPDLPRCTAITAHVAQHPVVQPIWHKNFETRLSHKWHRDG
ncbi:MAG: glutathione S-transferase [Pseudomonadota bacterium]